ncbi:MAG TPA: acyltransferase family protein, partial [Nocardioides sp.]|nr:acyltransferase family protein [Nocardioides sp.]
VSDNSDPRSTLRTHLRQIPSIQGLRAVAILMVVIYHAGLPLPGGFAGVDVFFVISGFVVTRMLFGGASRQRIRLRTFYGSRIRRLLPALAVMIAVVIPLSYWLEAPIEAQGNTALDAVAAIFSSANLMLYVTTSGYFDDSGHSPLLHTWSLGVEEQFYLILPVVIVAVLWFARSRHARTVTAIRWFKWLVVLGAAVSFLIDIWLCFYNQTLPAPTAIAFFFPVTRAWEFAIGVVIATWAMRREQLGSRMPTVVAKAVGPIGLLGIAVSCALLNGAMVFPGYIAALPALSTGMVLVGIVASERSLVDLVLNNRPMIWIGDRSYSWYLWHWPLIAFSILLYGDHLWIKCVAALVGLAVATASYRWIEDPIRRRRQLRFPTWRIAALFIIPPILGSIVLYEGAANYWGYPAIREIADQTEPKPAGAGTCLREVAASAANLGACTWTGTSKRPKIIIVGDSNADQYVNGFNVVAQDQNRTLIVNTAAGCSFMQLDAYTGDQRVDCLTYARQTLAWLLTQKNATVVVASANEYVDSSTYGLAAAGQGPTYDTAAKAALWKSSLTSELQTLRHHGLSVVVLGAIPHFYTSNNTAWRPSYCSGIVLRNDPQNCTIEMSLSAAQARQKAGLAAESEAVAAVPGVLYFPMEPYVCSTVCSVRDGNFWIYREGLHLSV